jgi:hypothetical protein|nr:MAG TPA: hypothetical protein [Caudoviricetes sp.]
MQYKGNYRKSIVGYLVSMSMGNTMGKVNLMDIIPIRGEYPHPIRIINPDVMDVVKNTTTYADYRPKVNMELSSTDLVCKDYLPRDKLRNPVFGIVNDWIDHFVQHPDLE